MKGLAMTINNVKRNALFVMILMVLTACGNHEPDRTAQNQLVQECEGGSGSACESVAMLYLNGEMITDERSPAAELANFFCTQGMQDACVVSDIEFLTTDGAAQMDSETLLAGQYFRRACDLDRAQSCYDFARLLRNAVSDEGRAMRVAYLERACDMGLEEACLLPAEDSPANEDGD